MAKHNQHLTPLHEILRRNASSQMMFAFVRGVLSCSPGTTVPDALRNFKKEFEIEDFELRSGLRMYYRCYMSSYHKTTFSMSKIKAKHPDGRSAEFTQTSWQKLGKNKEGWIPETEAPQEVTAHMKALKADKPKKGKSKDAPAAETEGTTETETQSQPPAETEGTTETENGSKEN